MGLIGQMDMLPTQASELGLTQSCDNRECVDRCSLWGGLDQARDLIRRE